MHQYSGLLSFFFNERKEVGRSTQEREGWRVRVCVMIRAVFFHYKLLCSSVELSGLHRDFGQLGVAHPGCHPPGTKQCRHKNTSTGVDFRAFTEHRENHDCNMLKCCCFLNTKFMIFEKQNKTQSNQCWKWELYNLKKNSVQIKCILHNFLFCIVLQKQTQAVVVRFCNK